MAEQEDDGPEEGFEGTLVTYEHAKREQLATEGPDPLRRELAALTRYLEGEESPQMANAEITAFREAKARVLREILAEADDA